MLTSDDIRMAVIPLAAALTACLDAAVKGMADGSADAQAAALGRIATRARAALDAHEEQVGDGLLEDEGAW